VFELKEDHEVDIERIDNLIATLETIQTHQADIKAIVDHLNAAKNVYEARFTQNEADISTKETIVNHQQDIDAVNKRIDDLPTGGTGDVTKEMLDEAVESLQANIDTKEAIVSHDSDISTLETKQAHSDDIQTILNVTNDLVTKEELYSNLNDLQLVIRNKLSVVDLTMPKLQGSLSIPTSTTPTPENTVPYNSASAYYILVRDMFGNVKNIIIPRNYYPTIRG